MPRSQSGARPLSPAFQEALRLYQAGELKEAHQACRQIFTADPNDSDALHLVGLIACQIGQPRAGVDLFSRALAVNDRDPSLHHNLGEALRSLDRLDEAIGHYRRALALAPDFVAAQANLGNALLRQGHVDDAVEAYRQAVSLAPKTALFHHNLGSALHVLGKPLEALGSFERSLGLNPSDIGALCNRGNLLIELQRHAEAIASYDRALAIAPDHLEAIHNRGVALVELGRYEEALASYDRGLALRPDQVAILCNRGIALQRLARYDDALASYDRALALAPDHAEAHSGRGDALLALRRFDECVAAYDRVLAARPDDPAVFSNRAAALFHLRCFNEALASCDRALLAAPSYPDALHNRGSALFGLGRYDEALAVYNRVLPLKPGNADILNDRANALIQLGRFEQAAQAFGQTLAIDPDYEYAQGNWFYTSLMCCDWSRYDQTTALIRQGIDETKRVWPPFMLLGLPASPAVQLTCSRAHARDRYALADDPLWRGERYRHDRIRIAYLSADFRVHAVANSIAQLLANHDRARFEVIGLSLDSNHRDQFTAQLERSFERFIDVTDRRDREVARMLRDLEVDIAIDLMGYTGLGRAETFAHRGAPIQVSYLGLLGTQGVDHIDYIIGDQIVIPRNEQKFFTEKIVYLPDTFLPNDTRRPIDGPAPTRAEAGLPEDGFVFCSFNNADKRAPPVFDVWTRLLREVPGSVLWLVEGDAAATRNLRVYAAERGVAPERLVFAPRVAPDAHLARHRLADLFLDTVPYNAGATAADALWAGLPVVTCLGSSFVGRIAASQLHAAGIPELVTQNLADYEALALRLARDPAALAAIKAKLADIRATAPLFDSDRYRRHIELAYQTMCSRYQRGEPPASFAVEP